MLTRALVYIETLNDALGFCMSEDADVLSQWRAYGDDGRGLAIGFDRDALLAFGASADNEVPFELFDVLYSERDHDEAVRPLYKQLRDLINEGALNDVELAAMLGANSTSIDAQPPGTRSPSAHLLLILIANAKNYFRLKHGGFSEEREWRLVANQFHGLFPDCRFRARGPRVVAYIPIALTEPSNLITEVVIGPRHATHTSNVRSVLQQSGLSTTTIRRSRVPYR